MQDSNFFLYGLVILAIVAAIFIIRKTASCLFRLGVFVFLLLFVALVWAKLHGAL